MHSLGTKLLCKGSRVPISQDMGFPIIAHVWAFPLQLLPCIYAHAIGEQPGEISKSLAYGPLHLPLGFKYHETCIVCDA